MNKVQLHDLAKIEEVIADEYRRDGLSNIHYNAEKKRLEATDGFILAIHPLSDDCSLPDHDCIIGPDAVAEARESDHWAGLEASMVRRPRISGALRQLSEPEDEPLIIIDVDSLARLARAICHDQRHRFVAVFRGKGAKPSEHLLVIPLSCDPGLSRPFGCISQVHIQSHHAFNSVFVALKDEGQD